MYRGYCRIPYPSTLFQSGQTELSPVYLNWKYEGDHVVVPKTFGFAARMEEDNTSEAIALNKKYYRVVTGEFINPQHPESKPEEKKEAPKTGISDLQRRLASELLAKLAKLTKSGQMAEFYKNKKDAQKNKEAEKSTKKPKETTNLLFNDPRRTYSSLNDETITTEASQVAKDRQVRSIVQKMKML